MAITINVDNKLSKTIDGILGLGADANSGPSFMVNLKASGKIHESMVTFDLHYYNNKDSNHDLSSVTFGGYDDEKYDDMTWFSLITNNWWALDMRKFSYGNTTIA